MTRFASERMTTLPRASATAANPEQPSSGQLELVHVPGLVPYLPMRERQQQLAEARQRGEIGDLLLLLEHEHVYTNGWRGDRAHLLADDATLQQIGASYHEIERGGDITYHGPGQLVAYPIIDLRAARLGVREYIGRLETVIIRMLATFDVEATTKPGIVGVWVAEEKIAAVGVKVRRGVAYHGFALNVNPDLDYFSYIVPCGLDGAGVTSLTALLGRPVEVRDLIPLCARAVAEVFDRPA